MKAMKSFYLFLALLVSVSKTFAQEQKFHTQVELVCETESCQPGKPLCVAIRMKSEKGWHTYWKNPGDSGMATKVLWKLPPGVEPYPLLWPVPKRFGKTPVVNFGYEGETVFVTDMMVSKDFKESNLNISAKIKWMECKDICIPREANLTLNVPVSKEPAKPNPKTKDIFLRARAHLPSRDMDLPSKAEMDKEKIHLTVTPPAKLYDDVKELWFFSEQPGIIEPCEPQPFKSESGQWFLELVRSLKSGKSLENLHGVLVIKQGSVKPNIEQGIEIVVPITKN